MVLIFRLDNNANAFPQTPVDHASNTPRESHGQLLIYGQSNQKAYSEEGPIRMRDLLKTHKHKIEIRHVRLK